MVSSPWSSNEFKLTWIADIILCDGCIHLIQHGLLRLFLVVPEGLLIIGLLRLFFKNVTFEFKVE